MLVGATAKVALGVKMQTRVSVLNGIRNTTIFILFAANVAIVS